MKTKTRNRTVLLIQPPHENSKGIRRTASAIPLGLAYLSTHLKRNDFKVKLLDIHVEGYSDKEVKRRLKNTKDIDIYGISAFSTQYSYVKWLISEIKKLNSNSKVVVGGPLATFSPEIVLKHGKADICVLGDGEETIVDILNNLHNLESVPDIYYKKGKKIVKNKSRSLKENIDVYDFPDWELFNLDKYLNEPLFQECYNNKSINIISARGCPFKCRFCSKMQGLRMRSIDNIIKEIKLLKNKYGVDKFLFAEELVMINKKRMHELCDRLEPLNITWHLNGRVNFADYELLKHMKKAGCVRVGYGLESGSDKILKNMNKAAPTKMAAKAIKNTIKAGIIPHTYTIFGYPGEDDQTIQETIDFCKKNHIAPNGFNIITPIPGSSLYDDCVSKRLIKDEEEYLLKLKSTGDLLVNFTDWSEKEFFEKLAYMRKTILSNYNKYRLTHPVVLGKEFILKIKRLIRFYKYNGFAKATRLIFKQLITDPVRLFEPEIAN